MSNIDEIVDYINKFPSNRGEKFKRILLPESHSTEFAEFENQYDNREKLRRITFVEYKEIASSMFPTLTVKCKLEQLSVKAQSPPRDEIGWSEAREDKQQTLT